MYHSEHLLSGNYDINIGIGQPIDYVHPMIEVALLATLLSEHNASHWEMSCSEWNRNRIEILSDKNLNSDAHEYLIDYLLTKVEGDCDAFIIGRK